MQRTTEATALPVEIKFSQNETPRGPLAPRAERRVHASVAGD